MLRTLAPAAALALLVPAALPAQWGRNEVSAERSGATRVGDAARIEVEAHAGSLRIEGRRGLDEVRAHGTARASSRDVLDLVRISVQRSGGTIAVVVEAPEDLRDREWAALDLVVEVPSELPIRVTDGSGDVDIRNVGALDLQDGSGSIVVQGVGGSLRVEDGSGEIRVRDVEGDVQVRDGSGEVDLQGVRGSVRAEDGSGGLVVRDVGRDVVVDRKGSGEIRVARVRGDLVVDRSVRRSVYYDDVQGRVEVPTRRDRRDRRDW